MDSFKGCLSSKEAGKAVEEGVKTILPNCEVICFSVADGGEGMLGAWMENVAGDYHRVVVNDPLMRPIEAYYGISPDKNTAFIEMAVASGLPLLTASEQNPMLTTTYGTGELILDALERGARQFVVGIGGSATNDAGLGMLQALGYRFRDRDGNLLGKGGRVLSQVTSIDNSFAHPALKDSCFTIVCDVNNPFCGEQGAAQIFARQKGADDVMIEKLDAGMKSFSRLISSFTEKDVTDVSGAGAAGGLGGAFWAFLNAELKPGIDLLLQTLDFSAAIKDSDLIITGEGKADRQSMMGKVASGILKEAKKQNVPVVLVAGSIDDVEILNQAGFQGVFSIIPGPISLKKAMCPNIARKNIRRAVAQIISLKAHLDSENRCS